MNVISIHRVRIWSALKFGFVVGTLLACLPGILCGLVSGRLVTILRGWLESWQTIHINLVLDTVEFNLVDLLRLSQVLTRLQALDEHRAMLTVSLVLGLVVAAGLFAASMTALIGVVYNGIAALSGGIEVEVEAGQAGALQVTPPGPPREPTAPLPPGPSAAWLVLAADPNRYWPLVQPVSRIGSQPGNDVILPFEGIGAAHAEIRLEEGRYVLYDRSEGRTWVNERPIAGRNLLKDGFQVRLGATNFIFRQQGG